jgi:FkbM family methyltransferase
MIKNFARILVRFCIPFIEKFVGFYTDPTGHLPIRLKMLFGCYESEVTGLIKKMLPSSGVFIDVGANVGFISHFVIKKCSFNGKVYAVEPNPNVYSILQKNVAMTDRISLYNIALANETGFATFYCGIDSAVGSLVKGYNESHHASNPKWVAVKEISVEVRKGDQLFANLANIDILKIDVEGYEMQAFLGMEKMINSKKIKKILMEFCPFSQRCAGLDPGDLISFFIDRDYKLYGTEDSWIDLEITNVNKNRLISSLGERGYTTLLVSA